MVASAGILVQWKYTVCVREKKGKNNNNSYSPFPYQWGDRAARCVVFVLRQPEMSATHTGGHQARWQEEGGQNADEKAGKSTRQRLCLLHIHAPRGTWVNRRLNEHSCPDTSGHSGGSKGDKTHRHTYVHAKMHTVASVWPMRLVPVAENRLSLSCCREQQEHTAVLRELTFFAAPPTFFWITCSAQPHLQGMFALLNHSQSLVISLEEHSVLLMQ